jgi:hypothetical protein
MGQSLSRHTGEVYRLPSEGVRLYPLGQYLLGVNQDYIELVQTVFFSCLRGGFVGE